MGAIQKRNKLRALQRRLAIPKRLERRYVGALTGAMGAMHETAMTWLRPKLASVVKAPPTVRADAMTPLGNEFEGEVDDLVGALAASVAGPFDALAGSVAEHNARAMTSLGIDVRGTLGATLDHLRDHNVQLMRRAGRAYADDVSAVLSDPESWGLTVDALAELIEKRAEVSISRATLIARDQSQKLSASINQHRQQSAGINSFIWSTSLDERVREEHADKEGQVFSWFAPPSDTGAPGDDILCRCCAVPLLPSDEDDDDE